MKVLKWIGIVVGALVLLAVIGFQVLKHQTRKHSPEETINASVGAAQVEVVYCRPYKKGREIFGELVPYDVVWRTGANDATTFSTTKDLLIGGKKLVAGDYTLWTIPGANQWQVIFNDHEYGWGVDFNQVAQRDPQYDALVVGVPVTPLADRVEQFKIDIQNNTMSLTWDQTQVMFPIEENTGY